MALQYPIPSGGSGGAQPPAGYSYPAPGGGALTLDYASPPPPPDEVALTGVGAAISLGTLTPIITVALTGIGIGVETGTMTAQPDLIEVPLTGIGIGVAFGYMRAPAELYDLAWTRPAYRSETIPSYLYIQYNDDDDLQAFVAAYNQMSQLLITWFAEINLPIYTGEQIAGTLLDWVALGLYGQARPTLPSGRNRNLGPFNTLAFNTLAFNAQSRLQPTQFFATTDEVFKRIITWNFFKGDGRGFSVRWLKRRIMRFLTGNAGADPGVDETYQISVTFSGASQVDIRILAGLRRITGGAIYNRAAFNAQPFNALQTVFQQYTSLEYAPVFKAAVEGGALQLPFQKTWIVTV